MIPDNWYEDAFGELYSIVYAHRSVASALPEAAFAARATGLNPKDRLLDLCCGTGRHLANLLQNGGGVSLCGFDYSPELLAQAQKNTRGLVPLIRGDMRALPFQNTFSVVFNFFTSFGYFMEDSENEKALLQMEAAMLPGGRFFFDYLNPDQIEARLVPESTRESKGYLIHEKRWIDEHTKRINKNIIVERDGQIIGKNSESVRMYALDELKAMLLRAGLHIRQVWGDYDASPYDTLSPRMLVLGCKDAS